MTKNAVIKKEGDKWVLYTSDGSRVLGKHDSKEDALKQEYAIEMNKDGSALNDLITAKEHSDKGEYGHKTQLVRNLLHSYPQDFVVDSPEGQFVGITHVPTGFKMHISRAVVPLELFKQQHGVLKAQNDIAREKRRAVETHTADIKTQQKEIEKQQDREYKEQQAQAKEIQKQQKEQVAKAKQQNAIDTFATAFEKEASAQVLQEAGVPIKDPTEILPGGPIKATNDPVQSLSTNNLPTTGPEAIAARLQGLDLAKLEQEQRDLIKSGKISKRNNAVKILNIIEGFKRNNLTGKDLLINKVPVIPPIFRPFRVAGATFVPGDANELYRDLFTMKKLHKETEEEFGKDNAGEARVSVYNAVKAVYGYGDPVNTKTATRGVTGFFKKVIGANPKYSFVQRQLLSKPQDTVSRGTITINPELTMNEVGVPTDMAWKMYSSYIQKRLVNLGYSSLDAVRAIKERNTDATKALNTEIQERPVIVSRAPAWHKFNAVAANPRLVDSNTIEINPFITTGMNADFDGDAMNVHVPASDEAVKEAYEKLLPSKMLFTIRDPEKVMPNLKHEQILSLYGAVKRPAKQKWKFKSEAEALRAIKAGDIPLSDEIEYPGMK
jgi:hypothetical protein